MEFNEYEKAILDYFFTSSDETCTLYAARPVLPSMIISALMGRASRAYKTFREIFLEIWKEATLYSGSDALETLNNSITCINYMTQKSEEFINKWGTHNSLRDTPMVTIFCDSLTILQTKVWEYEPVASYQEKSTRYRPFIADNICVPTVDHDLKIEITNHLIGLRNLYDNIMEYTKKRDIARYILPVGSLTAMACMAPVRSWERITKRMYDYPTKESQDMCNNISEHIRKIIPSFEPGTLLTDYKYLRQTPNKNVIRTPQDQFFEVRRLEDIYKINGIIDIGAHRDLQRHRSVIQGHPDYRAIYGYDKLVLSYLDEELSPQYKNVMERSTILFLRCERVLPKHLMGEAQFVTLLGHMTPFYFITNRERWDYIYKLRTGHPSQQSTTPQTVHFSYATWCEAVQKELDRI